MIAASAWMLLAAAPAYAATPDQLYQTWQKNSLQQPQIAEKAAADYLQAAPDGPHARSLQIWLDAYRKALSGFLAKAPKYARQAPNTKQASAQPPAQAQPPHPPIPETRLASAAAPKPPSAQPTSPAQAGHPPIAPAQTQPPPVQSAPKQASAQPLPQVAPPHPPAAVPPPVKREASVQAPPPPVRPETQQPQDDNVPKKQVFRAPPQDNLAEVKPGSLTESLAFIADKVGSADRIDFVAQFRDPAGSREIVQHLSYQASNVTIDPNRCQLSYRWHVEQDYRSTPDQDRTVELRLAKNITVETIDLALADLNRVAGHPFTVRTRPQVYAVHVARWDSRTGDNLYFRDSRTAARVGEAARHAMDLCDDRERQAFRGR